MRLSFLILLFISLPLRAEVIHSLCAEIRGLFGTGGLQHACLDKANFIQQQGHDIKLIMPHYTTLNQLDLKNVKVLARDLQVEHEQGRSVFRYDVIQFDHPENPELKVVSIRHKPGSGFQNIFENITENGVKTYSLHPNEGQTFGFFSKAYTHWMNTLENKAQPDLVVLNDWHTGFTSVLLEERKDQYLSDLKQKNVKKFSKKIPYVQGVIHNLKYQGVFSPELFGWIGADLKYFHGSEMHGQVNFLKSLLEYSDFSEAVSNKYAQEITTARFGEGLEDVTKRLAQQGRLSGLLNGINPEIWNPSNPNIGEDLYDQLGFSNEDQSNKAIGKNALIQEFFNEQADNSTKLVALTARIDQQKGFDFLLGEEGFLEKVLSDDNLDFKFLVAGDPHGKREDSPYIQDLKRLEAKYPTKIKSVAFSPKLERKFLYFSDFYLGASIFEPSGLAQMFAQSVGTVPIVSNVGGHIDSVTPGESGYVFKLEDDNAKTAQNLYEKFKEVSSDFSNQSNFKTLVQSTMNTKNSWGQRVSVFEKFIKLAHFGFFEKWDNDKRSPYLSQGTLDINKAFTGEDINSKQCFIPFKKVLGLRF